MNKKKIITLFFLSSFTLAACGNMASNDELTKEEVIEKVQEQAKELESVSQALTLTLENNLPQMKENMEQTFDTVYLYGAEGAITHIHTEQVNSANGQEQKSEFYKTPNEAYIFDGNNWEKYSGSENYSSTYKPTLDAFVEASSDLDMTESDTHYSFDFDGKNEELFHKVQPIFNITFNEEDLSNLETTVSFKISKESMNIDEGLIDVENNRSENEYSKVTGEMSFYEFDQTKDIEIPEEVKN